MFFSIVLLIHTVSTGCILAIWILIGCICIDMVGAGPDDVTSCVDECTNSHEAYAQSTTNLN
jgi:hypothetical protein